MPHYFRFLTPENRRSLLSGAHRVRYEPGAVILNEGERRRALFLLREGEVRVERNHGGFSVEVARLTAGEIFGEMSFVEDSGASASIVAEGSVEVDEIDEAHILALSEMDAQFYGRFYQSLAGVLASRLRDTTSRGVSEFSLGTRVEDLDSDTGSAADPWGE